MLDLRILYFGRYTPITTPISTQVTEGYSFAAQSPTPAETLRVGSDGLELVDVTFGDRNGDGEHDLANTGTDGDTVTYTLGGVNVSTLSESSPFTPITVRVTLSDGTTEDQELSILQMANGDTFLFNDEGVLNGKTVTAIELIDELAPRDFTFDDYILTNIVIDGFTGGATVEPPAPTPTPPPSPSEDGTDLLYIGRYDLLGGPDPRFVAEGYSFASQAATPMSTLSLGPSQLQIIEVDLQDANNDGQHEVGDEGVASGDRVTYTLGEQEIATVSTMSPRTPLDVRVTLADGTVETYQLSVLQMANGDTFLTNDFNVLDNNNITRIELLTEPAGGDQSFGGIPSSDGGGDEFDFDSTAIAAPPSPRGTDLLYFGNYTALGGPDTRFVAEGYSFASQGEPPAATLSVNWRGLEIVEVDLRDLDGDGAHEVSPADPNSGDAVSYTLGGNSVSTTSTMSPETPITVRVTLEDGTVETHQLSIIQMANGDTFLFNDGNVLDGDDITRIEIVTEPVAGDESFGDIPASGPGNDGFDFDSTEIVAPASENGTDLLYFGNYDALGGPDTRLVAEGYSFADQAQIPMENLFVGSRNLEIVEVDFRSGAEDGTHVIGIADPDAGDTVTYTVGGNEVSTTSTMSPQTPLTVRVTLEDGTVETHQLSVIQMANGDTFLFNDGNVLDGDNISNIEILTEPVGGEVSFGRMAASGPGTDGFDFDSTEIVDVTTTGKWLYLGPIDDIDTVNGNLVTENASILSGRFFNNTQLEFVDVTGTDLFDPNTPNLFRPDGAINLNEFGDELTEPVSYSQGGRDVATVIDSQGAINVEVTFEDRSTATIQLFFVQMENGDVFLTQDDGDELDNSSIRSIRIVDNVPDELTNAAAYTDTEPGDIFDRYAFNSLTLVCFCGGTLIETATGPRPVEDLAPGDLVSTRDNGLKPVSWIGQTRCSREAMQANDKLRPVRLRAGALAPARPAADLWVSRQHRLLLESDAAEGLTGSREVLVPAIKLTALDGVDVVTPEEDVTYYHILLDRHEVLIANGTPAESLLLGEQALKALGPDHLEEIRLLMPQALAETPPARPIVERQRDLTGLI